MAKVNFSARKDPLLRPRRAPTVPPSAEDGARTPDTMQRPRNRRSRTTNAQPPGTAGIEAPAGVIAVPVGTTNSPKNPSDDGVATGQPAPPTGAPARLGARRVQTTIRLAPEMWDNLDELARGAGVSTGELMSTVVTEALPDSPDAALLAVEQLLTDSAPDDGLLEERNFRLSLALRQRLDALARALGSDRKRSLLIRALLHTHTPADSRAARELVTTRRIDEMRVAARAATRAATRAAAAD